MARDSMFAARPAQPLRRIRTMTGHGERTVRAEQLRAGFEGEAEQGVAADNARRERQKRNGYAAAGVVVIVAGLSGIVVRLTGGAAAGLWTALYAAGIAVGATGAVLARRVSPRIALAVIAAGVMVMSFGDSIALQDR